MFSVYFYLATTFTYTAGHSLHDKRLTWAVIPLIVYFIALWSLSWNEVLIFLCCFDDYLYILIHPKNLFIWTQFQQDWFDEDSYFFSSDSCKNVCWHLWKSTFSIAFVLFASTPMFCVTITYLTITHLPNFIGYFLFSVLYVWHHCLGNTVSCY